MKITKMVVDFVAVIRYSHHVPTKVLSLGSEGHTN